jgi:hypothetical protein
VQTGVNQLKVSQDPVFAVVNTDPVTMKHGSRLTAFPLWGSCVELELPLWIVVLQSLSQTVGKVVQTQFADAVVGSLK